MANKILCPDCNKENHPTETACTDCGAILEKTQGQNITEKPSPNTSHTQDTNSNVVDKGQPYLEVSNMKAWHAAGEHVAFTFRICNTPEGTTQVKAEGEGVLAEGLSCAFIMAEENNTHPHPFQGNSIPHAGGNFFLTLNITCQTNQQTKHTYQASFMIDAISAQANQDEMIKGRIKSAVVEIENNNGILDLDNLKLPQGTDIKIKNREGSLIMENIESLLQQGKQILREQVEMMSTGKEESQFFTTGQIHYQTPSPVKTTHLLALSTVQLGRYTEDTPVDINLKCFPDNEENLRIASRISRQHCKIRYHQTRFEISDQSAWGTYINNTRLESDQWHKLKDKDMIKIADINLSTKEMTGSLQLKASVLSHALLLERVDNAPEEENYLILAKESVPTHQFSKQQPNFYHDQNTLHYHSDTDIAERVSPDITMNKGGVRFTFQDKES